MDIFETPIENISRIPRPYLSKIKKLGIKTLRDLLYYFPVKYEKFDKVSLISEVKENENNCVKGKIIKLKSGRSFFKKVHLTQISIQDNSGTISALWFGQHFLAKTFSEGDEIMLAGKVSKGKFGLYFSSPAYEKIENKLITDLTHTARIIPVYSLTTGVSSKWLRFIIKPLLQEYKNLIPENLPAEIIEENALMPINDAIWQAHFPDSLEKAQLAKKRFAFEEILLLQLSVLLEKFKVQEHQSIPLPVKLENLQNFISKLPYDLTDDQKKSVWKIVKDMERAVPMSRLLQGDVGSGKTVVAALASLNVIKSGYQVAFMAPTEILASQHFKTLGGVFKGFDANIGFLTGSADKFISKKLKGQPIEISKKKLIEMTSQGKLDIVVGTHALIKGKLKFKNLALVVIDEQHRFGTKQRASLVKSKNLEGKIPHLLSMTATPIPRSLALTIYGDLDISTIRQMPSGRKKIITEKITEEKREEMYQLIATQINQGRQAYVICPRIEEKQDSKSQIWNEAKNVEKEFLRLQKEIFPEFKVSMLHGKMNPKEKDRIMSDFKSGKSQILVSTSVIEVGVDVPNATVMLIEGADHFGLAQLHQFRGRVGRGEHQSYCFLLVGSENSKSDKRAMAMAKYDSGFQISQVDLTMRGPGEFVGNKQSGLPDKTMEMLKDLPTVEKTREIANNLLQKDPELKNYPDLKKQTQRYQETLHLE